nr:MAG TPA: hypothetical protein [Caudoviricetes sp.]DAZ07712.1 MAG TPA: hypothetical protein [Caudoviricetes sp.]
MPNFSMLKFNCDLTLFILKPILSSIQFTSLNVL